MNLKLFFSLIFIFAIKLNALAMTVSVGGSILGFGSTVFRGTDVSHMIGGSNYSASWRTGIKFIEAKYTLAFNPVIDAKIFIDFPVYIGLESGIGYSIKNSSIIYRVNTTLMDGVYINKIQLHQMSVPLFIKGQYEIAKKVNIYLGVGPKLNINLAPPSVITYRNEEKIGEPRKIDKRYYNIIDLDIGVILGFEVKIQKLHYVGLRGAYDANVVGSFYKRTPDLKNPKIVLIEHSKSYIDTLAFSLTYRYMFYY